jgi:GntR family negative regulator for fad regulon and positive regulator of fabA
MANPTKYQLLHPTQYVEHTLVTSILNGTYPQGAALPNERSLAQQLGVTRPTLRETLKRLATEGWIEIHHGKPTRVNDYWEKGGLRLLGTLAKYAEFLPKGFIVHLLDVRLTLLPPIAQLAIQNHPHDILEYLRLSKKLPQEAKAYATYDWQLQMFLARQSDNPVFALILNDFASVYQAMALLYFGWQTARKTSYAFYQKLSQAIEQSADSVEAIVKAAMEESIDIWNKIDARGQGVAE